MRWLAPFFDLAFMHKITLPYAIMCRGTILRYFTNLLKQRKNCEICTDSSRVISMRSWDKRNSSFAAAILLFYIRNFANYSDDWCVYFEPRGDSNSALVSLAH